MTKEDALKMGHFSMEAIDIAYYEEKARKLGLRFFFSDHDYMGHFEEYRKGEKPCIYCGYPIPENWYGYCEDCQEAVERMEV